VPRMRLMSVAGGVADDMYYVGGRGVPAIASRPDCAGMGAAASSQPQRPQQSNGPPEMPADFADTCG
jgi:hypothetical protein